MRCYVSHIVASPTTAVYMVALVRYRVIPLRIPLVLYSVVNRMVAHRMVYVNRE